MAVSGNPTIETVWLRWVPGVRPQKFTPKKNCNQKKSTVSDREFDYLSDTVEFFDLRIFLWVNFCGKFLLANFVKATVNTAKYALNTLSLLICMSTAGSQNQRYSLGIGVPHVKYILYPWPRQNQRMAPAQRPCAGFRQFSGGKFLHRARAARSRGLDSLPSLSDVATLSFRWIIHF
jgi:hypothetical protein